MGFGKSGGSEDIGDPVIAGTRYSSHANIDFSIASSIGKFDFVRMYTSSPIFWEQADGIGPLPGPFGKDMAWTHNLFSFVQEVPNGNCLTRVRRQDGSLVTFSNCGVEPYFLAPDASALELGLRLKRDGGNYWLYDGDRVFLYAQHYNDRILLTEIRTQEDGASRPALVALRYNSGCNDVPQIESFIVAGQFEVQFEYESRPSGECVLSYVKQGGALANYSYDKWGLSHAWGPTFDESYEYPASSGAFTVRQYGAERISHAYGGGRATSVATSWTGAGYFTTDSYVSSTCPPNTSCQSVALAYERYASFTGDGTRTPASPVPYQIQGSYSANLRGFRVSARTSPEEAGTWTWTEPQATTRGPTAAIDSVGNTNEIRWAAVSSPTHPAPPHLADKFTNEDGRESFLSWVWGDSANSPSAMSPLLDEKRERSLFGINEEVVTKYRWNTNTNHLDAEFVTGKTRAFIGGVWTDVVKTIGIFYLTESRCAPAGTDPFERTIEVHGPCFVSDANATDCINRQPYLVSRTEYDVNRPNDVVATSLYPNAAITAGTLDCGTPLTTTFGNHDSRGRAREIVSPDGVVSEITYDHVHNRVGAISRDGSQTTFLYDGDRLTAIGTPDGYWKIWCYRDFSIVAGCDYNSPLRTKPSAFAISKYSTGQAASEVLRYNYAPDGTLIETLAEDAEGTQRRVNVESNPSGDETFTGLGISNVGAIQYASYDQAHRVVAFGATPTTNCLAGVDRCTTISYQQRLPSRTTGGNVGDVCLEYDSRQNLKDVIINCKTNGEKTLAHYEYDDFGNVITATIQTPHNQTFTTKYAYSPRGEVAIKETPEMRTASARLVSTWDGLGRLRSSTRASDIAADQLLTYQEWDTPTIDPCAGWCGEPVACTANPHRRGQLAYRVDATGETWYNYDFNSRVAAEVVRPRNEANCDPKQTREYEWRSDGELKAIKYPYGRTVTYGFASGLRRPSSVSTTFFVSGAWIDSTVIDDIHWEPFGHLRFYRALATENRPVSVDYRGGPTTSELAYDSQCPLVGDFIPDTDKTGRVRKLVVKRKESGTGYQQRMSGEHVFSIEYEYSNPVDYQYKTKSCLLADENPVWNYSEMFAYAPMLATHRRTYGQLTPADSVTGRRRYDLGWDGLGGPGVKPWQEITMISMDLSVAPGGLPNPLHRKITTPENTAQYNVNFIDVSAGYDLKEERRLNANGQVRERKAINNYNNTPLWRDSLDGALSGSTHGGLESVYRAVSTTDGLYEYFYDATNRRRIKRYPSGESDFFFFRAGTTEMLSDVGLDRIFSPQRHPIDDYIWLDGKPVVIIRGLLDDQFARQEDGTGDCGRNSASIAPPGRHVVGTSCGTFFPVSDPQGRLVVMLDSDRKVAGVGESDPYGNTNRVEFIAESDHPYSPFFHLNRALFSKFQHVPWAAKQTEIRTRLHFFGVDVDPEDDAWLENDSGNTLTSALDKCQSFGGNNCGTDMGRVTSFWAMANENGYGPMTLQFRSGAATNTPDRYGVSMDYLEYLRSENGAKAWWPPIRLPGQYEDEETGFFENWNRFYDPSIGRYLSPEPLLQNPDFVSWMAQKGMSLPTYAYAYNNPLRYTDPTGLVGVGDGPSGAEITAFIKAHYGRNQYNQSPSYEYAYENWTKMTDRESIYHRHGAGNERNEKFISKDGTCEAVYRDKQLVTDPANLGTYNYGPPISVSGKIEHFLIDVVPYWVLGNTPSDPTPPWNRVTGP